MLPAQQLWNGSAGQQQPGEAFLGLFAVFPAQATVPLSADSG
jgi:hypothetical protein